MIEFENDPVWTPLNPKTGTPARGADLRETLAGARVLAKDHDEGWPVARWDAEAVQWVIAPPAPVEVTGVPSRWRIVDKDGDPWGCSQATIEEAWGEADRLTSNFPTQAPFSVEACVPVPRNEAT